MACPLSLPFTLLQSDTIVTKWFGDCTPGIDSNLKFGPGNETRQVRLCESAPFYRWKLTVATASTAGAGTNGQVEVQLRCGSLNATAPHVPLKCGRLLGSCFERCERGGGLFGVQSRRNACSSCGGWYRLPCARVPTGLSRGNVCTTQLACPTAVCPLSAEISLTSLS